MICCIIFTPTVGLEAVYGARVSCRLPTLRLPICLCNFLLGRELTYFILSMYSFRLSLSIPLNLLTQVGISLYVHFLIFPDNYTLSLFVEMLFLEPNFLLALPFVVTHASFPYASKDAASLLQKFSTLFFKFLREHSKIKTISTKVMLKFFFRNRE